MENQSSTQGNAPDLKTNQSQEHSPRDDSIVETKEYEKAHRNTEIPPKQIDVDFLD